MRGWLAAALLALPLLAQAAPARESDESILATKAAMDAFFSLRVVTPKGVSTGNPPEGFEAKGAGQDELNE